ncbi:MAG TPA: hypothetical protein VHU84_06920 [Lacipirellulaceae bacterium]|nr:hypothetical protein [Lacipirellulaceae bacterium]
MERLDAAKGEQGRATVIGNFLARMVNREVRIQVDGRTGKATLRSVPGRSRKVRYYFETFWDDYQSEPDADGESTPKPASPKTRVPDRSRPREETTPGPPRESPIDRSPVTGLMPGRNNEAW